MSLVGILFKQNGLNLPAPDATLHLATDKEALCL